MSYSCDNDQNSTPDKIQTFTPTAIFVSLIEHDAVHSS